MQIASIIPVKPPTRRSAHDAHTPQQQAAFFKPVIQPKLTINQPGDMYEQQADAMADKVMRMTGNETTPPFFKPAVPSVQRKCSHCEEEEQQLQRKETNYSEPAADHALDTYVRGLSQKGQPLSKEAQSFFEPRFGYDFSNVKTHTDATAAQSAQSVNALAYTSGNHIVFNSGRYSPETDSGKRLLGHELTHVVQQNAGNGKVIQRQTVENGCAGYTANEESISFTNEGHLPEDVLSLSDGRLLIADFGVNWRHVKPAVPGNPLLQQMFSLYDSDSSFRLKVMGYSDCLGDESHNIFLREGRARNIYNLLGSNARSRVDYIGIAPAGRSINDNSTVENRARNRSVAIEASQQYAFPEEPVPGFSCSTAATASTLDDYVHLVMCLERALPGYSSRQILSLLRQLYYSAASFTACRGRGCSFFSDVITCGLSIPDPRPAVSTGLYNALTTSKVVEGIDMGHVFTGLEAMVCPTTSVDLNVPGPNFTTDITNEEFATWAGDLGSAVAAKVHHEQDEDMRTQPWSRYFSTSGSLSSDEDLMGDIDSYVIRINLTGVPCAGSGLSRITTISSPVSDILFDYYIGNVGSAGSGLSQEDRIRCFTESIGGTISHGRITNKSVLREIIRIRTDHFASDFYRLNYHTGYFATGGIGAWIIGYSYEIADLFVDWLERKL